MTRVFTEMEGRVEVRRRVFSGELSKRAACREYEIHWQTLEKILSHSEAPGYQKTKPRSSIVDAFLPIIEEILKSDRHVHRRQRHTARRIFERLRDEHGYVGGETIVKDAVRACNKVLVTELIRGEYIDNKETVLLVRNSGTGKTHVATAPGIAATSKAVLETRRADSGRTWVRASQQDRI